jgi:hypothetical protein
VDWDSILTVRGGNKSPQAAWIQPDGCLCQASVAAGVGARVGAELL